MQSDIFIFEGLDGGGKSDAVSLLKEELESEGKEVYVFRDFGYTDLGMALRKIILTDDAPKTEEATLFLILAARMELVKTKLIPLLDKGVTILLDRFFFTTYAYTPRENWEWLDQLHAVLGVYEIPINGVFWLDVDFETSLSRAGNRAKLDVIESKLYNDFETYNQRYNDLLSGKDSVIKIDSRKTRAEIQSDIRHFRKEKCQQPSKNWRIFPKHSPS